MLFIRFGLCIAVFAPVVACSSASPAPLGPASSTSSSDDGDGGGSNGSDGGAHGSDGGSTAPTQGTATFNIDGKDYVATKVTAKRTARSIEIGATMNDGRYDQTMTLTFNPVDTGSSTCGSLLGDNDRSVVYSETFDDGGQTATEQQFMSGLGAGDPSTCTFDIDTVSPASGSASGTLDDSNSLIGGDTAVKAPVSFTVTWSGVP